MRLVPVPTAASRPGVVLHEGMSTMPPPSARSVYPSPKCDTMCGMTSNQRDILAGAAMVVGGIIALVGIVVVIGLGVNAISRHTGSINCDKMERSSGLSTHFDGQGMWSDGVCYVDLPDGTSIPRDLYYYEGSHP